MISADDGADACTDCGTGTVANEERTECGRWYKLTIKLQRSDKMILFISFYNIYTTYVVYNLDYLVIFLSFWWLIA